MAVLLLLNLLAFIVNFTFILKFALLIIQIYMFYHYTLDLLFKCMPYITNIGTHYANVCLISLKLEHIMKISALYH